MADSSMSMEIAGTEELQAKLAQLARDMPAALEQELLPGVTILLSIVKENTPVVTGRLQDSEHIGGHTEIGNVDLHGWAEMPGPEVTDKGVTFTVGTGAPYALQVEYGGPRNIARAMFRRAYDDPAAQDAIRNATVTAIRNLLGGSS